MKKLFFLIVLLSLSTTFSSQEKFSVDLFIDPSMALSSDSYGNVGFTPNLMSNVSVQLSQGNYGYFSIGQSIEYGDLYGGEYWRYSIVQVGYTINQFSFSDRLETTLALNYGITSRWHQGFTNYGCNIDISYCITDNLKLTSLLQVVRRTDIECPIQKKSLFRSSVFIGLKMNLFDVNVQ
jgi:hypothetical protein